MRLQVALGAVQCGELPPAFACLIPLRYGGRRGADREAETEQDRTDSQWVPRPHAVTRQYAPFGRKERPCPRFREQGQWWSDRGG